MIWNNIKDNLPSDYSVKLVYCKSTGYNDVARYDREFSKWVDSDEELVKYITHWAEIINPE